MVARATALTGLVVGAGCRPTEPAPAPPPAASERVGRIMATFHQGDVNLFDGDVLTPAPLRAEVIAEGPGFVVVDVLYGPGSVRFAAPSALPAATPRRVDSPPAWAQGLPAGAALTLRAVSCPTESMVPEPNDGVVDEGCGVDRISVTAAGPPR